MGLKPSVLIGFGGSKGRCRYMLFCAEEKAIPKDLLDALAVEELAFMTYLEGRPKGHPSSYIYIVTLICKL